MHSGGVAVWNLWSSDCTVIWTLVSNFPIQKTCWLCINRPTWNYYPAMTFKRQVGGSKLFFTYCLVSYAWGGMTHSTQPATMMPQAPSDVISKSYKVSRVDYSGNKPQLYCVFYGFFKLYVNKVFFLNPCHYLDDLWLFHNVSFCSGGGGICIS